MPCMFVTQILSIIAAAAYGGDEALRLTNLLQSVLVTGL